MRSEPPTAARRPRGASGLTLLEVLAAVALLGLVYTVLASKATQGVMSEHDSLRRFNASLLADRWLAEIETVAAMKATPELGRREEESADGIYRVGIEVSPWSVPTPPPPPGEAPDPGTGAEDILAGDGGRGGALLQARVRVSWDELLGERSVERTTFLLDYDRISGVGPEPPPDDDS